MSVFGVDYAWGRPGAAALKHAGVKFACRYLSHDTTGKNLTPAEARSLAAERIWLVVVWESTRDRALSGRAAGVADAKTARAQAENCGMPAGRPIYFAVDWDASISQQAAIHAYLDGAASVIGRGRVGLYAGYYVIKRAFDAHKITWGWQTYAWSGGHWDGRAQLQQYKNDQKINGVGLDYDRATTGDYGQWMPGVEPAAKEDDVELTDDVNLKGKSGPLWSGQYIGKGQISVNYALACAAMSPFYLKDRIIPMLQAQQVTIEKLVDALSAAQPDLDALKAAIREAIESIDVKLDVSDAPDVPADSP